MTPADLDALNRRIFTAHPELADGWKPGLIRPFDIHNREIPPPNIMDWDTFGRVLMCLLLTYKVEFWQHNTGCFHVTITPRDNSKGSKWQNADTPQLALALAVDAMEQK